MCDFIIHAVVVNFALPYPLTQSISVNLVLKMKCWTQKVYCWRYKFQLTCSCEVRKAQVVGAVLPNWLVQGPMDLLSVFIITYQAVLPVSGWLTAVVDLSGNEIDIFAASLVVVLCHGVLSLVTSSVAGWGLTFSIILSIYLWSFMS